MPSAHSRRTRLSYSTELEKAKQPVGLVQTPIERVQETLISSSQSSVSRYWTSSNTLDNIRMTSFGFERTDYTYGDR
ncbi:hypothetical protein AHF37_10506 [Paragonimus kellicotti]|nr:hypothetical protein AHF37_10506 [Paragonimus kellicotti]